MTTDLKPMEIPELSVRTQRKKVKYTFLQFLGIWLELSDGGRGTNYWRLRVGKEVKISRGK